MKSPQKIKILAVDDAPDMLELYHDLLTAAGGQDYSYELTTASSAAAALKLLAAKLEPDVVILDVFLQGASGLEVCRKLRQWNRQRPYVGVIFITGSHSPELLKAALELGADDFCSKLQTSTELLARLRSVIRIKKMADSLRAANEKLRAANERLAKITITDDLTGLYNMHYFKKRLAQEFIRAERYHKYLSLIMMDLDHFKVVNDRYDHLMGSYVLAETGRLIAHSIRSLDIAARYGGDEYVVLLPETNEEGAFHLAERIGENIAAKVFDNSLFQVQITASIGVSTLSPETLAQFPTAAELLRAADRCLYQAKEQGRARVVASGGIGPVQGAA